MHGHGTLVNKKDGTRYCELITTGTTMTTTNTTAEMQEPRSKMQPPATATATATATAPAKQRDHHHHHHDHNLLMMQLQARANPSSFGKRDSTQTLISPCLRDTFFGISHSSPYPPPPSLFHGSNTPMIPLSWPSSPSSTSLSVPLAHLPSLSLILSAPLSPYPQLRRRICQRSDGRARRADIQRGKVLG
jgi:hypothetical protein